MAGEHVELYNGPPCQVCKAKKYYDEAGYTYCRRGHIVEVHPNTRYITP